MHAASLEVRSAFVSHAFHADVLDLAFAARESLFRSWRLHKSNQALPQVDLSDSELTAQEDAQAERSNRERVCVVLVGLNLACFASAARGRSELFDFLLMRYPGVSSPQPPSSLPFGRSAQSSRALILARISARFDAAASAASLASTSAATVATGALRLGRQPSLLVFTFAGPACHAALSRCCRAWFAQCADRAMWAAWWRALTACSPPAQLMHADLRTALVRSVPLIPLGSLPLIVFFCAGWTGRWLCCWRARCRSCPTMAISGCGCCSIACPGIGGQLRPSLMVQHLMPCC